MSDYADRWDLDNVGSGSANPLTNKALQAPMYNRGAWGMGIGAGTGALLSYLLKRRRESGLGAALKGGLAGAAIGGLGGAGYGYYNDAMPFLASQQQYREGITGAAGTREGLTPYQALNAELRAQAERWQNRNRPSQPPLKK